LIQIKTDLLFCDLFRWSLTGSEKENPGTRIAVFADHNGAENTVKKLNIGGFAVKPLTAVGKFYHTEETLAGFYSPGDRVKFWAVSGACFPAVCHGFEAGWLGAQVHPTAKNDHTRPTVLRAKRVSFTKRKIV
jgi:hypothetical protein